MSINTLLFFRISNGRIAILLTLVFFNVSSWAGIFTSANPTETQFRTAFAGKNVKRLDAVEFQRFVSNHASEGRLLTGPLLATHVFSATAPLKPNPSQISIRDSAQSVTIDTASNPCRREPLAKQPACQDSLAKIPQALRARQNPEQLKVTSDSSGGEKETWRHLQDTLEEASRKEAIKASERSESEERTRGFLGGLFVNLDGSSSSGNSSSSDDKEWAAVIYVVVGVVVVGAFIFYGIEALTDLILNEEKDPVFQEIGLRYSYSGFRWSDGGPELFRNTHLLGLRYAIGLDRPIMGLGLAMEGGYIDLSLKGLDNPSQTFNFSGTYLLGGPMLRFGHNQPYSFTLEFLNGTSSEAAIGWISKSRMSTQVKVTSSGLLLGAHLGAVFYDLNFFDGLAQRQGDFNRDLSLLYGLDLSWEF